MRRSIKEDLFVACDALDHLVEMFPRLSREERIDIVARLRGAAKTIDKIDSMGKDEIKAALKHKEGALRGEIFTAVLSLITCNRLDQQKLKVDYPTAYNNCLKRNEDERITFEPR